MDTIHTEYTRLSIEYERYIRLEGYVEKSQLKQTKEKTEELGRKLAEVRRKIKELTTKNETR